MKFRNNLSSAVHVGFGGKGARGVDLSPGQDGASLDLAFVLSSKRAQRSLMAGSTRLVLESDAERTALKAAAPHLVPFVVGAKPKTKKKIAVSKPDPKKVDNDGPTPNGGTPGTPADTPAVIPPGTDSDHGDTVSGAVSNETPKAPEDGEEAGKTAETPVPAVTEPVKPKATKPKATKPKAAKPGSQKTYKSYTKPELVSLCQDRDINVEIADTVAVLQGKLISDDEG